MRILRGGAPVFLPQGPTSPLRNRDLSAYAGQYWPSSLFWVILAEQFILGHPDEPVYSGCITRIFPIERCLV